MRLSLIIMSDLSARLFTEMKFVACVASAMALLMGFMFSMRL